MIGQCVYIAGPMTGIPGFNYPEFNSVAAQLRALGLKVENPAENLPIKAKMEWSDWMRLGIIQLMRCDRVVLLRGWENSPGAKLEFQLATKLGIECVEWAYAEEQKPQ